MRLRRPAESECRTDDCIVTPLTEWPRFKGMSVDDFLGGGFMEGEDEDEVRANTLNAYMHPNVGCRTCNPPQIVMKRMRVKTKTTLQTTSPLPL